MKPKELQKKLTLNKQTVATLDKPHLNAIKGGYTGKVTCLPTKYVGCPTWICPPTQQNSRCICPD
jgi:hypothetical protein